MEKGKSVTLDIESTLTLEHQIILQQITENKDELVYDGRKIKIKPGFKIFLVIHTSDKIFPDHWIYNNAIVERASEIIKFEEPKWKDLI